MEQTRRSFLKTSALTSVGSGVITGSSPLLARPSHKLNLALASYSLRKFPVNYVISAMKRLRLTGITLKSFHLPLESGQSAIAEVRSVFKQHQIDVYGCGVIGMKNAADVERAFTYAESLGAGVIVASPRLEVLDLVEQYVAEYGIKVAIHNHGPDDVFPGPRRINELLKGRHPDLGICIDIGHTIRNGEDPAEALHLYGSRIFDVHFKDVSVAGKEGQTVVAGSGVIDLRSVVQALVETEYAGRVAIEFEPYADDPMPSIAECLGYLRGIAGEHV